MVWELQSYKVCPDKIASVILNLSNFSTIAKEISNERSIEDAQIIVNFACLKRHFFARMTCAIKNNVGAVAGSGGSETREILHSQTGSRALEEVAEIAAQVNPDLTIVDAEDLLIGNGPFSSMGQIRQGINKLIIICDIVAVDAYCAEILAQDDNVSSFSRDMTEPKLQRAQELGLGISDIGKVEIIETTV